jgi:hypothetical protein
MEQVTHSQSLVSSLFLAYAWVMKLSLNFLRSNDWGMRNVGHNAFVRQIEE